MDEKLTTEEKEFILMMIDHIQTLPEGFEYFSNDLEITSDEFKTMKKGLKVKCNS